jgi:hypothetical protein
VTLIKNATARQIRTHKMTAFRSINYNVQLVNSGPSIVGKRKNTERPGTYGLPPVRNEARRSNRCHRIFVCLAPIAGECSQS